MQFPPESKALAIHWVEGRFAFSNHSYAYTTGARAWRAFITALTSSRSIQERGAFYRFGDLVEAQLQGKFWNLMKKREDGAVLALLQERASGRKLLAVSTHLYW
jgi:hypothetical protein